MASAPLRVFLTISEEKTLLELSRVSGIPQRTKDRASALRLSSMGWKIEKIAIYFKWSKQTVRATIHRWQKHGLIGLWDKHRSGRKTKWQQGDLVELEKNLEVEQQSYTSKKIRNFLLNEQKIDLSERQIRRILKKNIDGKELENPSKESKIQSS